VDTQELLSSIAGDLDSDNPVPLYEQLTQKLRLEIERGRLSAGSALPAEPEIARLLGVSRQTVNVALTALARRGLLTRRRGTGTFVAEPFVEQPLSGLYSFIHTLESQGRLPGARLLGFQVLADERASSLLAGSEDALVYEIRRLRLVDGEPFAIETTYLRTDCGQQLALDRLETTPLYDMLEESCGLRVTRAHETLRPTTLDKTNALLLSGHVGEPAFLVERIGFVEERAVELRLSLIRGDRYRFTVELTKEEDGF
jgi:GntR family transcriptional regulator